MRPSTRCRGRCTPTTRCTASWSGRASGARSPRPRGVHADDEVDRILARLGIGEEFAAHRPPALGLRLIDPNMRTLAEIPRSTEPSANGYPQMNMFDQPELEAMLRANVKRYPQ